MLSHLQENRIAYSGAGRKIEQAGRPAILEKKGIKIGVISITDNEPVWAASEQKAGTYFVPIDTDHPAFSHLKARISKVKKAVDVLVLTAHWGPNMVEHPPVEFQNFARQCIEAGADIFHGHSAHIFQGIEIYNNKLIMYDTGDFVDDYIVDPFLRNDLSFVFLVKVDKNGTTLEVELVPTAIGSYQVNLATGEDANWALHRMQALSAEFGTEAQIAERSLIIDTKLQKAA